MTNVTPPPAHSSLGDQRGECKSIGYLVVGGRKVGLLRCGEPAGHDEPSGVYLNPDGTDYHPAPGERVSSARAYRKAPGTPHRAILTWDTDVVEDWPEAYDPAEPIDVEVPLELPADYVGVGDLTLDELVKGVARCPECAASKHGNCDGRTWDYEQDATAVCPCPCRTQ